jgi:putative ABC transport system permease protein
MNRLPSLAVRNVGRNRRRSVITGVTILFGVMMVIFVRGLTEGLTASMAADVVEGRLGALQVHRAGFVDNLDAVPTRLNLPHSPELLARLAAVPHVRAVTARVQFNGLVGNGLAQTMFIGRGVDVAQESAVCPRAASVVLPGGRPLARGQPNTVLVGAELAASLKATPGQLLNLQTTSPSGRANALDLTVTGLTTSSFPFENKRVVTVPLETAQALLGLEGRVTEYAVAVDDLSRVDEVAAALRRELGDGYEVHTWLELQPFVRDLLVRFRMILAIVSAVLIVIVLTGIVNTMLMAVFERVREIGTLLAVGVRRAQVAQLFLTEAATIGLLGGVGGALAGEGLVAVIAHRGITVKLQGLSGVNVVRPQVTLAFVGVTVALAVVCTLLAALVPSLRASKLNPVDALRA